MAGTFALVVAAGRGTRFGGDLPKQYLALGGRAVLHHAAAAFAGHAAVAGVQVVIRPEDAGAYDRAVAALALLPSVPGGAERQDSVRLGLEALAPHGPDRVLIHDGARPFPSEALIDRVLAALEHSAAAIPALPLGDTIKRVEDETIRATVDRSNLWRAQTPQGFHFREILAAHRAAAGRALADDDNLKITSAADLAAAERLLAARLGDVRIGQGFDVHPYGPGDHIWVCGVAIPHEVGAVGHSDADVGLHAITDAVLGAIGAGDIGMHFPPSNPRWKGASSDQFLRFAADLVRGKGGVISAVDVTIICERPRISPHRTA